MIIVFIDLESVFNNEGSSEEFDYELDLSGEELDGAKPFTAPVRVRGNVHNRAGIVELEAEASSDLDVFCDRCAVPFRYPLLIEIRHTLVSSLNDDDNDDLILVNDMNFNLDELVTEDIFLLIPSKFLCKEDCKGLCPTCGKDLNEGPCDCKKEVDPRFASLLQLLEEDE